MGEAKENDLAKPFFVIYVVWHPSFELGEKVAGTMMQHFRRDLYRNIVGGAGIPVVFRSVCMPGSDTPISVTPEDSEASAIIALLDDNLCESQDWVDYLNTLSLKTGESNKTGFNNLLFPVSFNKATLQRASLKEQALRWDLWKGDDAERITRLISELTYEFCRMLRHHLAQLESPSHKNLQDYLKKVQIFLSHSKHDEDGIEIATAIRMRIYEGHGLSSFFDVNDIPAGLRFDEVLLEQIRISAMVAIHTDSYSSREWCRKEIIEAKIWNIPLVVANSINNMDERGFPYMGNVPVVRLGYDPTDVSRIDIVISRLLDEVLKDFLWRCQTHEIKKQLPRKAFLIPRPPELISLSSIPQGGEQAEVDSKETILIYPDPPLSTEEERLINRVSPNVQLRSLAEWKAGATR
ncbi:toll/interleukin-1 receptor domain-containing protein [Pseudomonas brenneri]|uniref:toll/interleukin-1 receptor domain-containing protein n=1 Tax=Pseudomonas fluorescens group TaxID=136843 RepID=UPI00041A57C5|nr:MULTISPECIES: toll/interleukin-1 receptor domain-containing protein [Pseudomonas fluorescens group]MBF8008112.1 toll/interleukin-1 receptor domain-containing protein [Pseudomonas brenneri]WJM93524.1 toll/interleukin-1 receptor domain-containing protein [Pseudomonas brenneri]